MLLLWSELAGLDVDDRLKESFWLNWMSLLISSDSKDISGRRCDSSNKFNKYLAVFFVAVDLF